jgi:hypothetical protein
MTQDVFQKLLDNMAVKTKRLWVCGFSNCVDVSVTSFGISHFCAWHIRSICYTCMFSCVNAQWLTFWLPVYYHITSYFLDKILNNASVENSKPWGAGLLLDFP